MANVLMLDMDVEYPEVIGLVTDLKPWVICRAISQKYGIQLTHEDALSHVGQSINIILNDNILYFEKYVWRNSDCDGFLHLIQNKIQITSSLKTHEKPFGQSLFENVEKQEVTEYLFPEWKAANYIVYSEGLRLSLIHI